MQTGDDNLHDVLAGSVTVMLVGMALYLLVRRLRRTRPALSIGLPVGAALGIRALTAAGISLTGIGGSLRGGDEILFTLNARDVASAPFGSEPWTNALVSDLHEFIFASQISLLDSPELALRIGHAGIAVMGLALLAVAVYELAGPRAATIAMWALALEPTNVFFTTLLHKEALMLLATGLVAFGGAIMWKRVDLRSLLPMALGCLIALATRPYAGWFLIATAAAITLHASLRVKNRPAVGRVGGIAAVVLLAAVFTPTIIEATSDKNLERRVQRPQNANTRDATANLALEEVDFSSRTAILTNLPVRVGDVLFRPYIWQLDNTSQQLGLFGSLVALAVLIGVVRELFRNRGKIMGRAGPLIYLGFFTLVAYSLSAGNAGTAFRYRTHVVAIGFSLLVVLWFSRQHAHAGAPSPAVRSVWPRGSSPSGPVAEGRSI